MMQIRGVIYINKSSEKDYFKLWKRTTFFLTNTKQQGTHKGCPYCFPPFLPWRERVGDRGNYPNLKFKWNFTSSTSSSTTLTLSQTLYFFPVLRSWNCCHSSSNSPCQNSTKPSAVSGSATKKPWEMTHEITHENFSPIFPLYNCTTK